MERNDALERVAETFVGSWTLTLTNQWWDPEAVITGTATCEWLGASFLRLQAELDGNPTWDFVFGRSDANDRFVVLYGDERGVLRAFELTLHEDGSWSMLRADPDFHQRFLGQVDGQRMVGSADASEDEGATWRKDFDMLWERTG